VVFDLFTFPVVCWSDVDSPCAVYDDPYRGDELWDGWAFRVGTWNMDSLTGRLGELVEALAERRMDVLCVQETR